MFTTIRAVGRAVAQLVVVLGAWVLILLAMPFVGPAGRQVAVIGDGPAAVRVIARRAGTSWRSAVERRWPAVTMPASFAGFTPTARAR
ncbi:Uncharacterised protein [Sphingomonas paucimobilis]|nr:Uncharacterised protein [Sphingomonas paucimobilis]